MEARIGPQWIPDWLDFEPVDAHTSFRARPTQPLERGIRITQPEINGRDLKGLRRNARSLQVTQDLPGAVLAPAERGSSPETRRPMTGASILEMAAGLRSPLEA